MPFDPKHLQTIVEGAAPPDMELDFKSMFGGIIAYAGGKPFCSLSDVGLALKMDDAAEHKAFLTVSGAKALQYDASQPVSKTYVVVPDTMLQDRDALREWIKRSVASLRAKPSKNRKR